MANPGTCLIYLALPAFFLEVQSQDIPREHDWFQAEQLHGPRGFQVLVSFVKMKPETKPPPQLSPTIVLKTVFYKDGYNPCRIRYLKCIIITTTYSPHFKVNKNFGWALKSFEGSRFCFLGSKVSTWETQNRERGGSTEFEGFQPQRTCVGKVAHFLAMSNWTVGFCHYHHNNTPALPGGAYSLVTSKHECLRATEQLRQPSWNSHSLISSLRLK